MSPLNSTSSDADILRAVCQGQQDAFGIIVERYRPRLLRFAARSFRDNAIAEDLVQETFVAVYAARETFDDSYAFSTWAWTILLNLCRREHRRRKSRIRTWSRAAGTVQFESRPDEAGAQCERDDESERLSRLLDALPAPQADALRLRFFAELSFDEIAAAMNSSISGAKGRVRKGLEALAGRIGRERSPGKTTVRVTGGEEDLR